MAEKKGVYETEIRNLLNKGASTGVSQIQEVLLVTGSASELWLYELHPGWTILTRHNSSYCGKAARVRNPPPT
jgi:hypothetical protein